MKKVLLMSVVVCFGTLQADFMDEPVVFVQASAQSKPTYDQFRGSLSAAHNAAFGDAFLFKQALDQKHVKNWTQAMKEAKNYVKKTAVLDRDFAVLSLNNAMDTLVEASNTIVLYIVESYRSFFGAYAQEQAASGELIKEEQAASKELISQQLQPVIKKLTALEESFAKKIKKGYHDPRNQQAAELVHYLALALVTTAEKVQRDLRK